MTIRQIRSDIEKIKKTVKPDPEVGLVAIYRGELGSLGTGIRPGSTVAIDGRDVSNLDPVDTQAMLSSAKTLIFIPDNGRDPGIWM